MDIVYKKYKKYREKIIGGSRGEHCKTIEFVAKFMPYIVTLLTIIYHKHKSYNHCLNCKYVFYLDHEECPSCKQKTSITNPINITSNTKKKVMSFEKYGNSIKDLINQFDDNNINSSSFNIDEKRIFTKSSEFREFNDNSRCVTTTILLVYFISGHIIDFDSNKKHNISLSPMPTTILEKYIEKYTKKYTEKYTENPTKYQSMSPKITDEIKIENELKQSKLQKFKTMTIENFEKLDENASNNPILIIHMKFIGTFYETNNNKLDKLDDGGHMFILTKRHDGQYLILQSDYYNTTLSEQLTFNKNYFIIDKNKLDDIKQCFLNIEYSKKYKSDSLNGIVIPQELLNSNLIEYSQIHNIYKELLGPFLSKQEIKDSTLGVGEFACTQLIIHPSSNILCYNYLYNFLHLTRYHLIYDKLYTREILKKYDIDDMQIDEYCEYIRTMISVLYSLNIKTQYEQNNAYSYEKPRYK